MVITSKYSFNIVFSLLIFIIVLITTSLYGYIFEGINIGLYSVINAGVFVLTNIASLIFSIIAIKRKEPKSWLAYTYLFLLIVGIIWAAIDL